MGSQVTGGDSEMVCNGQSKACQRSSVLPQCPSTLSSAALEHLPQGGLTHQHLCQWPFLRGLWPSSRLDMGDLTGVLGLLTISVSFLHTKGFPHAVWNRGTLKLPRLGSWCLGPIK